MLELRLARVEDARALAELHARSWLSLAEQGFFTMAVARSFDIERVTHDWPARLTRADERTWLMASHERVLGFVRAGKTRDRDARADTGEIHAVHVLPDHVHTGLGQTLFVTARSWLRAEGHRAMTLWVYVDNLRARAFYERLGMTWDGGTRSFTVGDEVHDEVRYRSSL